METEDALTKTYSSTAGGIDIETSGHVIVISVEGYQLYIYLSRCS